MEAEHEIKGNAATRLMDTLRPQDTNERHIYLAIFLILLLVGVWRITHWPWVSPVANNVTGAILGFLTGKAVAKLEQK